LTDRPDSESRSLNRRLRLALAFVLVVLTAYPGAPATAGATSGIYVYDALAVTRVGIHHVNAVEPGPAQLSDARKQSASPTQRARGTATTSPHSFIATEAASAPRVTEPMIRDAMADAPLQTQQGAVSLPKVQSAVDQLAAGSPAPPIRVDGSIIVDGNHRYIAGQIMGQPPAVQPWPGGNPARVIPWWKQVIDPTDWGG
jgi:hypothetical protein